MAQKGLCNIAKKTMLEDSGAPPREDGDFIREYKATHEDRFLISWLEEDLEGEIKECERLNKEAKEEESKSGKIEVERGE